MVLGRVGVTRQADRVAPASEQVQEFRTEKTFRTSMARSLRWIFAVVVFAAALVLYLSLD